MDRSRTRRLKCSFAVLVALVLVPMAGRAEVRLQAGNAGPELVVQPVAQGVWTPSGVPDAYTVNPQGDLLGDGYPAQGSADGHLVAAWERPSRHAVVVLRATSPETSTLVEVATGGGVGMPIVTSLNTGFLVTWQDSSNDPVAKAVVASDAGVSSPISIVSGRLLDVYRIGDSVHVVAFDAVGRSLNIGTIPASYIPTPIPVPEGRVPARLRTTPGAYVPHPIPIPVGLVPVQRGNITTLWTPNPIPVPEARLTPRLRTVVDLWEPNPIPIGEHLEPQWVGTTPATYVPNPIPIPGDRVPVRPGTTPALWVPNPIPIPVTHESPLPGTILAPHEPSPIPVPVTREPPELGAGPASWFPNPIPVPEARVPLLRTFGAAPLETTPPPEFVTNPDTWQPCVEERGTDVLLAWQAGRSVLGRVILTSEGVEGAGEFFWSPNGSCQAVLNAAERH